MEDISYAEWKMQKMERKIKRLREYAETVDDSEIREALLNILEG